MTTTDVAKLKSDLKKMIVEECQKNLDPEKITDDEILIGTSGTLGLDSLDALQIALAVQQRYGRHIEGNNETRMALTSINTLANFILAPPV